MLVGSDLVGNDQVYHVVEVPIDNEIFNQLNIANFGAWIRDKS